ncbi:bifunctional diguanylate cyclase/phosphodiesterase [Oscillospiraceae bacterium PP1C4]
MKKDNVVMICVLTMSGIEVLVGIARAIGGKQIMIALAVITLLNCILLCAFFLRYIKFKDKILKQNDMNKNLYTAMFNISSAAVWEWNLQTKEFKANAYWCLFIGGSVPEQLSLEEFYKVFYPLEDEKSKRDAFRAFLDSKKEYYQDNSFMGGKDGKMALGINSFYLLRDQDEKPMIMIGSIFRQQFGDQNEAYDTLTALPSRHTLLEIMKEDLLDSNKRLKQSAFLIIDINNFRQINGTYGYSNGDNILRQVGMRLASLNSSNTLVSRGDSNDFAVYISDVNLVDEVDMLVNQAYSVFKNPFYINETEIKLTVCIAATQFYSSDIKLDQIIHSTFVALDRAKSESHNENNFVLFNQSMLIDARQREKIIFTLERFKENDCLRLYYQPQFSTNDDKLHAFEALLRLEIKGIGAVSPSKFIPLAEETGLIIEIGYWVLYESCQAVKRFQKSGMDFTSIAVNVSLVQIIAPDFINNVKKIINECDVNPSCLEFEITESVLMSSIEYGEDILRQLKEFGVGIVLDDFGSGYSSLNYIRALSIDTLKIDKVFIDGICSDNKSKYIVEMVLNLAKQIGLEVVAEGVENFEQLEVLRYLQCPVVQGYYCSIPLPEDCILERYASHVFAYKKQ